MVTVATPSADAGFGELWRKRYTLRLQGNIDPEAFVSRWRNELSSFWPNSTHLASDGRLAPGRAFLLHVATPVGHMETALVVESLSPTSFQFGTMRGHMFAGTVTCSAGVDHAGDYAEVLTLFRTSDPLFGIGFKFGVGKYEDWFWTNTLGSLASAVGVHGRVWLRRERLDRRLLWRNAGNVWSNAAIRTAISRLSGLARSLIGGPSRRRRADPHEG